MIVILPLFVVPAILMLIGVIKGLYSAETGKERLAVLLSHILFFLVGYYLFRAFAVIVIICVFIGVFLLIGYFKSNVYTTSRTTIIYKDEDE